MNGRTHMQWSDLQGPAYAHVNRQYIWIYHHKPVLAETFERVYDVNMYFKCAEQICRLVEYKLHIHAHTRRTHFNIFPSFQHCLQYSSITHPPHARVCVALGKRTHLLAPFTQATHTQFKHNLAQPKSHTQHEIYDYSSRGLCSRHRPDHRDGSSSSWKPRSPTRLLRRVEDGVSVVRTNR